MSAVLSVTVFHYAITMSCCKLLTRSFIPQILLCAYNFYNIDNFLLSFFQRFNVIAFLSSSSVSTFFIKITAFNIL